MNQKDKVLVTFYEDQSDLIVLGVLNKITRRRNFSNKMKDMLLEHIRTTMPDIYAEVEKELLGKDEDDKIPVKVKPNQSKIDKVDSGISGWGEV